MFKYVETMRKVGFRIFSKTYGGRSKETNEPIYDSYPLKTLARVLCFEDMDEARHACQHYNITVKEKRMDSPSGVRREEIVHWRRTPFKEPKDPSKGTIIPLKPRKMIRTIEGKLRGAPRLAVCRGAVSGAESSELISTASSIQEAPPLGEQFGRDRPNPEGVANKADDDLQAAEKEATKSRVEKEQLQRKLKQRDEERKKLLLIREQRAQEAEHELRAKAEKEREAQRLQTEQEKERRNAAEKKAKEKAKRLRAEAAAKKAQEAKRKADEEHRRLEAIKEKERLAQQEQRRIEEERQLREAEELLRRQELEVERRRLEAEQKLKEERKRIREAELRKQKLERDAREQAALQSHLEWQAQAVRARKKVLWRRWLQKVPLQLALLEETHESLSRISEAPTDWISCAQLCSQRKVSPPKQDFRVGGIMNVLSALDFTPFPLESMVSAVAERFFSQTSDALNQNERGNFCKSTTFLFKVAVFFPSSSSSFDKESRLMLQIWMKSQLRFGRVLSAHVAETDVRVVFIDGTTEECGSNCDAAMVVSLDCFSDSQRSSRIIAPGVPVVALLLPVEHVSGHPSNTDGFSPVATHITRVESMTAAGYKEGFQECVEIVFANLQIQAAPSVESVSVMRLCALCISRVIWLGPSVESPQGLVESARQALFCLLDRLEHCASAVNDNWPAAEFFSGDDVVKDYFGKGQHLPRDWAESTRCGNVARAVKEFARLFDGTLSLSDLVARLVHDSPDHVQRECAAMLDVGLRRRYLQTALEWKTQHDVSRHVHKMYMPVGFLPDVLAEVSVMCKKSNRQPRVKLLVRRVGEFAAVEKFTAPSFSFSSVEPKYEGGNRNARHGHAKPSLQEPETSSGTMKKRQRTEVVAPPKRTKSIEASEAFTKRLKSMAQGTPGKDMLVGRKTLSGILRKSLS